MRRGEEYNSEQSGEDQLAQISAGVDPGPSSYPANKVRVTYQGRHQQFWYPQPEVPANQPVVVALDEIHGVWEAALTRMGFCYRSGARLLWSPAIETARLSTANLDNIEEGLPRAVILTEREAQPELTAFFKKRAVPEAAETFAVKYQDTVTGTPSSKVLVVSLEFKKVALFRLVLWGLVLSLLVGVALGIATSNVEIGLSAFASMTLVMTVPLGVVFWMTK